MFCFLNSKVSFFARVCEERREKVTVVMGLPQPKSAIHKTDAAECSGCSESYSDLASTQLTVTSRTDWYTSVLGTSDLAFSLFS